LPSTQKLEKAFLSKILDALCIFSFSDKLKFSIKVSLSLALAYLIPLSQGWPQASTAAITVMLIAAMGSVSESVLKGAMRVLGTIIGAAIGMTLIALFPQERMIYLIILSIIVSIPLYLVRAYRGDPSIFMLTAMTMMLVFKNGEVDDVFIYGLDKTYMTIFGITVYTAVGVFLWPVDIEDTTRENAIKLSETQSQLFLERNASEEKRQKSLALLVEHEDLLEKSTMDTSSASIDLQQWHSIIYNYKNINGYLTLLSLHNKEKDVENLNVYVSNYDLLEKEITQLLKEITVSWEKERQIEIPQEIALDYQTEKIKELSHLERASLISMVQDMQKLHKELCTLAIKLNRIHSPLPTFFDIEKLPEKKRFLWGDIEHLKGVLVTFIIFWTATFFWIELNPAGGFMIVALATGLSVLTTFTPIKPSMLIVVFSISFIFAALMYVAVLPHLRYGWELGLFIFAYSFVSFYLVNPKMTIFFLLGLFTFGIANTMYYDFGIFLLLLLMFYLFLVILHIFYYIPFSSKPEHLFLVMSNRFFYLAQKMLERGRKPYEGKVSRLTDLVAKYSALHLMSTVKKMQLWADGIDVKYFDTIDKEKLLAFTKESEKFAYLVELLYHRDLMMKDNPLMQILSKGYTLPHLSDILHEYAKGKGIRDIDIFWKDQWQAIHDFEVYLSQVLVDINFESYAKKDIAAFYENISLRKNVWLSFLNCQKMMQELDINTLKLSRF
jgi:uncharacterized membrane protein YgaE (UPF0421/DUF939 family)